MSCHLCCPVRVAMGMRQKCGAPPFARVPAQRNEALHAHCRKVADDRIHLLPGGVHAGQMRGGRQIGCVQNPQHRVCGALARGAARPVGDGDEAWPERCETLDRLPQLQRHIVALGGKEFERDADLFARLLAPRKPVRHYTVSLRSEALSAATATRVSRASHSLTVSPSAASPSGAKARVSSRSSSASASHSPICRSEKPSRRCACSSRRNSCACGAKSTITSFPPGRKRRAASRIAAPGSSR